MQLFFVSHVFMSVSEVKRDPFFPDSLLPHLGRTMKMVDYAIRDYIKFNDEPGLTKKHFILLKVLLTDGEQPQHKLALITERNKASLTRLLTTLEKKGYIRRYSSDADHRIKQVSITKQGEEVLRRSFPLMREITDKIQKGISREDIDTTIRVLQSIQLNIKENIPQEKD